jgi:hypothetical protein
VGSFFFVSSLAGKLGLWVHSLAGCTVESALFFHLTHLLNQRKNDTPKTTIIALRRVFLKNERDMWSKGGRFTKAERSKEMKVY